LNNDHLSISANYLGLKGGDCTRVWLFNTARSLTLIWIIKKHQKTYRQLSDPCLVEKKNDSFNFEVCALFKKRKDPKRIVVQWLQCCFLDKGFDVLCWRKNYNQRWIFWATYISQLICVFHLGAVHKWRLGLRGRVYHGFCDNSTKALVLKRVTRGVSKIVNNCVTSYTNDPLVKYFSFLISFHLSYFLLQYIFIFMYFIFSVMFSKFWYLYKRNHLVELFFRQPLYNPLGLACI
jgi:hypothetical protein